jgi:hypothetical protein
MLLSWFSEMPKLVWNFTSVSASTQTYELALSHMNQGMLNPLPSLTLQSARDLNVPCWPKRSSCPIHFKCPLKKTRSFCPCSRALNRSSKGLTSVQESPLCTYMWCELAFKNGNQILILLWNKCRPMFHNDQKVQVIFIARVQFQGSNSTDIFEYSGWPACLEQLSNHHNYYLSNTRLLVKNALVLRPPLAIQ